MKYYADIECDYCNSTLHTVGGRSMCTGDNLAAVKTIFDAALDVYDEDNTSAFDSKVANIIGNDLNHDLFTTYWEEKKQNPKALIRCVREDKHFIDVHADPDRLPIPDPYIPFPDLAEVYIAEVMLSRELSPLEKDGRRFIPKIHPSTGGVYFEPLLWIRWPADYISLKDMAHKTDYTEGPLPKIFDMESIRGICKGRNGNIKDV